MLEQPTVQLTPFSPTFNYINMYLFIYLFASLCHVSYTVNYLYILLQLIPLWLVMWNTAGCNVCFFFGSPCSEWLLTLPVSKQSHQLQFLPDWVSLCSFWHMSCSVFLRSPGSPHWTCPWGRFWLSLPLLHCPNHTSALFLLMHMVTWHKPIKWMDRLQAFAVRYYNKVSF